MIRLVEDDLSGPEITELLRAHVQGMHDTSPPDSIHTLSLDALRAPDITVWTAWDESSLMGCAALKELDAESGEIKSMRTAEAHLRKGVAANLLSHIVAVARKRGYKRLYLETGSSPAFEPAHAMYLKAGFTYRGPFADYTDDPFSRFMAMDL